MSSISVNVNYMFALNIKCAERERERECTRQGIHTYIAMHSRAKPSARKSIEARNLAFTLSRVVATGA